MIQALKLAICHDKTFSLDQLGMSKTPVSKRGYYLIAMDELKG